MSSLGSGLIAHITQRFFNGLITLYTYAFHVHLYLDEILYRFQCGSPRQPLITCTPVKQTLRRDTLLKDVPLF